MKFLTRFGIVILAATLVSACAPRDTTHYLSIRDALNSKGAAEAIDPKIKLYFGKPAGGKVLKANLTSIKSTNAFNKSDVEACNWAFLSAIKSFQERAVKEGGSKVSNLVSYHKKNVYKSADKFECHAGHSNARVTLRGDIVR